MNDRVLGYIVIAIIVFFLILPIGYLFWQSSSPLVTRTIAFENVHGLSFLSVQDPVNLQGVEVGIIRDVTIKGTTAFIEIETRDTLRLFEDYSITVIAKGVMGDRYLIVMPGTPQKKTVPATALLYGKVAVGADEALSHIGELKDAIHELLAVSERLKNGGAAGASLVDRIWEFTGDMDSLTGTFLDRVSRLDTAVGNGLDSAHTLLVSSLAVADRLNRELPSATGTIDDLIQNVTSIITKMEELVAGGDSLRMKLENPESILWRNYTLEISENLSSLRTLLKKLQGDSLELPVKLW